MNPEDPRRADPAWLSSALQDLPNPPLPEQLFTRIMASRQRRRRQRRLIAAAGLLLALSLLLPSLERARWSEPPPGLAHGALSGPAAARLLSIDRQLQAAYDRGDSAEQIATLWQTRERLVLSANQEEAGHEHILSL